MKTLSTISLLLLAIPVISLGQAPGDLVVTPTRIRLDERSRSADITLVNRGTQAVRYRLSLVDMEMTEAGALKRVPSTGNSAQSVLRMSPREVLLEPGASQRIKVAAFFPADTGDRELRSHLAFEPIAIPKASTPQDSNHAFRLNFELRSVVTIPVIALHGKLSASAGLTDASITDGSNLTFKLSRSGSRTIRGEITVTFIPASGGPKTLIAHASGMPVYFPNPSRIVTLRLDRDVRSLGTGEVEIRFAESEGQRSGATARMVVKLQT